MIPKLPSKWQRLDSNCYQEYIVFQVVSVTEAKVLDIEPEIVETDGEAATQHYVEYGYAEGRSADSFDELAYIASHTDLIAAFETDTVAAAKHYIEYGSTEGRTVTFDAGSYLAAHADLRVAFGTDEELATKHYIEYGSDEGRALT